MIVCICHRISDRDIVRATREGCASFDELQLELGVATSCGRCRDCACETFHAALASEEHAHAGRCEAGAHRSAPSVALMVHRDAVQAAVQAAIQTVHP
jgi:bacterioferritin-associated ferredoxin